MRCIGTFLLTLMILALETSTTISQPVCEEYQLQAYRRRYTSSDQCWTGERRMRGATPECCERAFGGRCPSYEEMRKNVDWVLFADAGARATYLNMRNSGLNPFDSVVGAQGHNPRVQQLLRACQVETEAYLASQGQGASSTGGQGTRSCLHCPQGIGRVCYPNRCNSNGKCTVTGSACTTGCPPWPLC